MQLQLGRYSIGMGDRFARQGPAQLEAVIRARQMGIELTPVWNKSHREHRIIGTSPRDVRAEADAAVRAKGYAHPYFVDADHINMGNVDPFLGPSDFFTIDVSDYIDNRPDPDDLKQFVRKHRNLCGRHQLPGVERDIAISTEDLRAGAERFMVAIQQAARIYRYIAQNKGQGRFLTEVSMDETDRPQGPVELLLILVGLADEGVPVQTIAPRFSGRFNKGVDYVGDLALFAREFREDVAMVQYAQGALGLPAGLKLSIHSGSDKFSLYPIIRQVLVDSGAGLHLKTAGTTWLEELTALAQSGSRGLAIAKQIYLEAIEQMDHLCGPYRTVIDIDRARLPSASQVRRWSGSEFVSAVRHDPGCPRFNPHVRQLLHVAYKVAADMGRQFLEALEEGSQQIGQAVTDNLLERHIRPMFPPAGGG